MCSVAATAPPSVWRRRDFRLAWAGGLINDTGDWVLLVALPVFVFTETGSGSSTALLFVCQLVVSMLLGPIGGSLVDRWDLRRCLVATNLAQAVTLLPLLAVDGDRVWPAYLVIVAQSVLTQVNNPANVALLPRLVDRDQLTAANAALSASQSLARLIGAPVGGIAVAIGGLGPVVLIDAVSYLGVALGIGLIRSETRPIEPEAGTAHPSHRSHIVAGLREIRSRPVLRSVLAINAVAQIAQGCFVILFVVFVVERLGGDGTEIGIIRGTMAIGAVIGAAVITRVAKRTSALTLLTLGSFGIGVADMLFWNASYVTDAPWVYIVLFALSGIPGSAMTVGVVTTIQSASPPEALGRVVGVMEASGSVGTAIGSIGVGLLIGTAPLMALVNGQAVVIFVCAALLLRVTLGERV